VELSKDGWQTLREVVLLGNAGIRRGNVVRMSAPKPAVSHARTGISVLIIEDNADGSEMLALAPWRPGTSGHPVRTWAARDRAGYRLLVASCNRRHWPAGIDGYEIARRLRQNSATSGMRLVALTGYGLAKDRAHALEVGFDRHVIKPVNIDELVNLLDGLCK
jgi:CheY-like chemotaxis protein